MESLATLYPVIFFDGEQEHDRGYMGIHSVLSFKRFRSLLSQKTGVPPNQLSIVFICRRMQNDVQKRHRLPINGNTNFNILLSQHIPSKEKDCYFFVSLKKSKKDRGKGSRKRGAEDGWEHPSLMKADPFLVEEGSHITSSVLGGMLLQDPGFSQYATEAHIPSPFTGSSFDHCRPYGNMQINETSEDKILMKRSNVASFPRRRWIYPEQQVPVQGAKLFMDDECGYTQSPRLAALQQDERVYEWSAQDAFLMETGMLQAPKAPYFTPYHNDQRNASDYQNLYIQSHGIKAADGPSNLSMDVHLRGGVRKFNFSKAGLLSSRVTALPTLDGLNGPELRKPKQSVTEMWGSFADYQSLQNVGNCLEEVRCHVCLDCKNKNICPVPFHWCIGDIVTEGFQGPSPAGPIGRPSKPLVQP